MKRREVFNSNAPSRWQRVKRRQTRYHDDALDDVEPCHVHSYSTTILNMKRREVFNSNAPSRWQRVKRRQTRYHDDALDDVEPCHVHSYSTTILNMKRREGVNSNAPSLLQRVKRDQSPLRSIILPVTVSSRSRSWRRCWAVLYRWPETGTRNSHIG